MFKNTKAFSGFSVDSLDKAKDFYGGVLGLDVTETPEGLTLSLGGGGKIFVYEKQDHTPASFTILNFPVPNVEQAVDDLTVKGVQFEIYNEGYLKTDEKGIMRSGGPLIAWFKDPAGNFLSVVEEK